MTLRDVRAYLIDIEGACHLLTQFSSGKMLEDYLEDALLRSAVERQFEIIGEALNRAIAYDQSIADHVTDAGDIVAFRNRLIHGYSTVSHEVVWGVLQGKLPALRREIHALLSKKDPPSDSG